MKKKIKENIDFIYQFIDKPKSVGALIPSSKFLTKNILSYTDLTKKNLVIVEYGPGSGTFTREIVKGMKEGDTLIVIEQNKIFAKRLREQLAGAKNVFIHQDCVTNTSKILKRANIDRVDYIISGIPFSSIPKKMTEDILENTKKIMSDETLFITFQYSTLKINTFKKHMTVLNKKFVLTNIPSAYTICMKKCA